MKIFTYTLLVLFFASVVNAQDASQVLKNSAEKYAGLKSYRDSGKVIIEYYNLPNPMSKALLFKTAYQDNGSFNFEYYELGSTALNVLNRDANKQVKVWQGFSNRLYSGQPFNVAMAGFVGISSLTVALVPTLLMPDEKLIPRTIYDQIPDPKIIAMEQINKVDCYKITSRAPNDMSSFTVWISKDDLLIRKAENVRKVKDFNVKTSYNYVPYSSTDQSVFTFRPARKVSL